MSSTGFQSTLAFNLNDMSNNLQQSLFYRCYTLLDTKLFIIATNSEILALSDSLEKALSFVKLPYNKLVEITGESLVRHKLLSDACRQLDEYSQGKRKSFDLALRPLDTNFKSTAIASLLKVPYGQTISYSDQAQFLHKPKAQRAIGSANSKNPYPIFIPCHRVVPKGSKIGGYSLGAELKEKLLKLEAAFCQI